MSGLWLNSQKYQIRIWKEDWRIDPETKLPVARIQPGNSDARRAFFYQPPLELEYLDDAFTEPLEGMHQVLKLVINWALDRNLRLGTFDLACPSQLDRDDNTVATHWWVPIPRLDTSINGAVPSDAPEMPPELLPEIDLGTGNAADNELDADSR